MVTGAFVILAFLLAMNFVRRRRAADDHSAQAEPDEHQRTGRSAALQRPHGCRHDHLAGHRPRRDMALVAAIGFGTLADTYSLGNSLPNIIYILVAGVR